MNDKYKTIMVTEVTIKQVKDTEEDTALCEAAIFALKNSVDVSFRGINDKVIHIDPLNILGRLMRGEC